MNPPVDGHRRYLDVRYASARRPRTSYPRALCGHLTERFAMGRSGARLVDLGCGRGEYLEAFAELGFEPVGVDRCAPSRPPSRGSVLVADWEKEGLPLETGSVDLLFSKSVLEHSHDVSKLLGECHRVLRPGGRSVHLVPDFVSQWRHFYDDWTHVRPFTLTGLVECLECHGFEIVAAEHFRQLPWLWTRPWLRPVCDVAERLPDALKARSKLVRFSKEWMLLVVADKPKKGSDTMTDSRRSEQPIGGQS